MANEIKGNVIPVYADDELKKLAYEFQEAKEKGLLYNGKKPSYSTALKLGLKIYLGVEDKDEEKLEKDMEEYRRQARAFLEMADAAEGQLEEIRANKAAAIANEERQQQTVLMLAEFLEKQWYELTEGQHRRLRLQHICESVPEYDLTPEIISPLIPRKFNPEPTKEEFKELAATILKAGAQ